MALRRKSEKVSWVTQIAIGADFKVFKVKYNHFLMI